MHIFAPNKQNTAKMKTFTPQFTLDDLYRSPFNRQRALDPITGSIIYNHIERQESTTGIELLDRYIDMLNSSLACSPKRFALQNGLEPLVFSAFIFALTALPAVKFQHAYMMRKADDLLRYTSLTVNAVADNCGWPPATLCRKFKKKYRQTPARRRWDLQEIGDQGRYAI